MTLKGLLCFKPGGILMPYAIEKNYVRFDHPEGARGEDIVAEIAALLKDPAYGAKMNCLVDLRTLPKAPETRDVRRIAAYYGTVREKIGPKIAFIVKNRLEFGMMRMFGILMEAHGFEIQIFETEGEAISWLKD